MKVVVADTSPINYLVLIDSIGLLRSLYRRILIPVEVFEELTAAGAPPEVAAWVRSQPEWIKVVSTRLDFKLSAAISEADLDAGEHAAIRVALAETDTLLLIDEAAGRSVASQLGVPNTGTLGILVAAAKEGLVDLKTSLRSLQSTNFRISKSLIDEILSDSQLSND